MDIFIFKDKLSFDNDFNQFKILPPIIDSFKIICLAFNYIDQPSWLRFDKNPPREPIISMKPRTSLIGPIDDILCPKFVKQLDYEGELALVIGKKYRKVTEFNALEYVSGYFILNYVSARHLQSSLGHDLLIERRLLGDTPSARIKSRITYCSAIFLR